MASTYLTRTVASASNRRTWTFSAWCKRSGLGDYGTFLVSFSDANNQGVIRFMNDDTLDVYDYVSGAFNWRLQTNRLFRDTSAWYHIVVAVDTTQATASDRVKIYVNGVQETSFATSTYPAQDYEGFINRNRVHSIGNGGNNNMYFDGSMSHIHFIDGTAYQASDFGSTDSTTGEWKINTSPSVSYGTNGFFLLKDDNAVTDRSGQGNNFTLGGGTLTKTEDCPSNVFCTLNPLFNSAGYFSGNTQSLSFSNGNTYAGKVTHGTYFGTIGVSSGKYYWEVKVEDTNNAFGIMAMKPTGGVSYAYDDATSNLYYPYSDYYYTNGSSGSSGSGDFDNTSNKIYSFALDATNNKMWIGRDGTFIGDPVAGTGATWSSLPTGHDWTPVCHPMSTTQNNNTSFNFGNGYFGTTAVSSAGTNASGIGIFEYDVPTGFTALSTKGLNE